MSTTNVVRGGKITGAKIVGLRSSVDVLLE